MAIPLNRIINSFNTKIEEPVRKHLKNVYACLTMSAASAAVGAYINLYNTFLSAGWTIFPALGLLIALHYTQPDGKNTNLRLGYLLGFAFFLGTGMSPLINFAISINPSIIFSALVGTIVIFSCFTLSVLFAPRGYWLFIAGSLSTLLSTLFFLSLANIFFASQWIYQINVYIGLLAMCGFVMYDTTIIIEKCRMNDKDFIIHSLNLFEDFIGIFKKLLIILSDKEYKEKSRSKNK